MCVIFVVYSIAKQESSAYSYAELLDGATVDAAMRPLQDSTEGARRRTDGLGRGVIMPRSIDIEARVLTMLRNLVAGYPVEDARAEMKAKWPDDPSRAARRIAGHANAFGGEDILWIIGADEKSRTVAGADHVEFSAWWRGVQAHFSEITPQVTDIIVPFEQTAVVALLFSGERIPYVVKNAAGGAVSLEVPWREGTHTRSSRRSDLIQLLVPRQAIPEFEVLSCELTFGRVRDREESDKLSWTLYLNVYIKPGGEYTTVIPYHESSVEVSSQVEGLSVTFEDFKLRPRNQLPQSISASSHLRKWGIETTLDEAIITAPCRSTLYGTAKGESADIALPTEMTVTARLLPFRANVPAVITATLVLANDTITAYDQPYMIGKWIYTP